jgi:hypothetical protein
MVMAIKVKTGSVQPRDFDDVNDLKDEFKIGETFVDSDGGPYVITDQGVTNLETGWHYPDDEDANFSGVRPVDVEITYSVK